MSTKSIHISNKAKRGFTLIELLVVIAIIGLLASIVAVAVNSARKKARDVKRKADIKQLATAFNMVASGTDGDLPMSNNKRVCISPTCGSWITWPLEDPDSAFIRNALSPYVNPLPSDPVDGRNSSLLGYAYYNQMTGGTRVITDLPDYTFPTGAYLVWNLDPAGFNNSDDICSPGFVRLYYPDNSPPYIRCNYQID